MSISLILEGVRDYLRTANTWDRQACGIQHRATPPATAGPFFAALDDGGAEGTHGVSYYLGEIFTVEIGVWRRFNVLPKHRLGQVLLSEDLYREDITTLEKLSRIVITDLHNIWAVTTAINTQFSLPSEELGDRFSGRMVYTGRGRTETVSLPETATPTFLGWRLRFRGMKRIQRISNMG